MSTLWAFAPFIVFVVVQRIIGIPTGLFAAALIAAAQLIRDVAVRRKSPKVLEIGTLILFAGLGLYTAATKFPWSIPKVRLVVDIGLLVIVLISIFIRRPFTIQYAREQVSPELWESSRFVRTNYFITGAWAVAFLLMVIADVVMVAFSTIPTSIGIGITVVAIVGAVKFTDWYPKRTQTAA